MSGIVTFTVDGIGATEVRHRLARQQMNVSVSTADGARLATWPAGISEVVRASVHYYNDEAEVDRFARAIAAF